MSSFKPMLAATCNDVAKLKFPVYASCKLDGIRCIIKDGVALSRSLKPIRNKTVQAWATKYAGVLEGCDGELISGEHDEQVYLRTNSVVMSEDGSNEWTFWCFDRVRGDGEERMPYTARINRLRGDLSDCGTPDQFRLVPRKLCDDVATLNAYEEKCLDRGYEGCMVRAPDAPYKYGRSTTKQGYLLKIKRFVDSEAQVVGYDLEYENVNPEKRDATGKMNRSKKRGGLVPKKSVGALLVRDLKTGVHFKIGTGFTQAQRKELYENEHTVGKPKLFGRIIKYKSFPQGVKDAPRHPVFLGFRDPDDM